jgi:hypothetical protein
VPQGDSVYGTLFELARGPRRHELLTGIGPRVMWIGLGGAIFFGAYSEARKVAEGFLGGNPPKTSAYN